MELPTVHAQATRVACLLLLAVGAGCASPAGDAGTLLPSPSVERPRLRSGAVRLPAFAGEGAPRAPWQVVDAGALWRGPDGRTWRTPHVLLRSDADAETSRRAARLAENHVRYVFREFGTVLDLRAPRDPFPVVLHARRTTFAAALGAATREAPGWGAFYDPHLGTIHTCLEEAPTGALPVEADLRHEMTHQILDLSTPAAGRWRIFQGHYLWLWEGFAAASETWAESSERPASRVRRARFEARRARGEVETLSALFVLPQEAFLGRHYDQVASLVSFLLADGVPGSRRATLETLRDLLRGRSLDGDLERRLGLDATSLERVWTGARR